MDKAMGTPATTEMTMKKYGDPLKSALGRRARCGIWRRNSASELNAIADQLHKGTRHCHEHSTDIERFRVVSMLSTTPCLEHRASGNSLRGWSASPKEAFRSRWQSQDAAARLLGLGTDQPELANTVGMVYD